MGIEAGTLKEQKKAKKDSMTSKSTAAEALPPAAQLDALGPPRPRIASRPPTPAADGSLAKRYTRRIVHDVKQLLLTAHHRRPSAHSSRRRRRERPRNRRTLPVSSNAFHACDILHYHINTHVHPVLHQHVSQHYTDYTCAPYYACIILIVLHVQMRCMMHGRRGMH